MFQIQVGDVMAVAEGTVDVPKGRGVAVNEHLRWVSSWVESCLPLIGRVPSGVKVLP